MTSNETTNFVDLTQSTSTPVELDNFPETAGPDLTESNGCYPILTDVRVKEASKVHARKGSLRAGNSKKNEG